MLLSTEHQHPPCTQGLLARCGAGCTTYTTSSPTDPLTTASAPRGAARSGGRRQAQPARQGKGWGVCLLPATGHGAGAARGFRDRTKTSTLGGGTRPRLRAQLFISRGVHPHGYPFVEFIERFSFVGANAPSNGARFCNPSCKLWSERSSQQLPLSFLVCSCL